MRTDNPKPRNKPAPEGYRNFNGNYVHDYPRPFFERNDRSSRLTYNPETGIGELYLNSKAIYPADLRKSEIRIGKLLQKRLNATRYICRVKGNQKTRGEDTFNINTEFHFASKSIPDNIQDIPSLVEDNILQGRYKGYSPKTGEIIYCEFNELPEGCNRYLVIQECNEPTFTSDGKRSAVQGYIWNYA